MNQTEKNCRVIDKLVEAYNSRDARAFADLFLADAWHGNLHGTSPQIGREEIFRRYVDVFAMYPENRTEVVYRAAYDCYVIDHEKVRRSMQAEPFDVVAIYTFDAAHIKRVELVRR